MYHQKFNTSATGYHLAWLDVWYLCPFITIVLFLYRTLNAPKKHFDIIIKLYYKKKNVFGY